MIANGPSVSSVSPEIALTVVPYVFLFVAAQAISDYVAYRDIFHPDEVEALPSYSKSKAFMAAL